MSSDELNPYAPPEVESFEHLPVADSGVLTRQVELEGTFRLAAIVYIALAILSLAAGNILLALATTQQIDPMPIDLLLMGFLLQAFFFGTVGYGVIHYYSFGRWGTLIISVFLAGHLPFGTLFHGYLVLRQLCTPVGRSMFTAEYRELIRQTPHLKLRYNKFSLWAFGLFWLQFVVVVALMALT
jgi:hypothetical protein